MSDPSPDMLAAILAAVKADERVIAAFEGATVRVYDIAPTNTKGDYIIIGDDFGLSDIADCIDASEFHVTAHILSLTVPAGQAKARRIAAAVLNCLLILASPVGWRIVVANHERTTHLTDPDGKTAHSVVAVEYLIDPA